MSLDEDPWRWPRPRLMEGLRAMSRQPPDRTTRDLAVLAACAVAFIALLVYL